MEGGIRIEAYYSGGLVNEINDNVAQNHGNKVSCSLDTHIDINSRIIFQEMRQWLPVKLWIIRDPSKSCCRCK